MDIKANQEYLEGEDPEYDINDLNKIEIKKEDSNYQTSAFMPQSQIQRGKLQELESKYETIIKNYEDKFKPKKEENFNEDFDKKFNAKKQKGNLLNIYNELKSEVELIEKDLKSYNENKEQYKSIAPIEATLEELNKLKYIISYIESSKNFDKLKKINDIENHFNLKFTENNYNILNKKLYKNLDEQLNKRLNELKKLKQENPVNYNNMKYELFLSPDNEKMQQLKELDEIISKINKVEEKLGKWNFNNKKNTISYNIDLIKRNYIFIDKVSKNEFLKKFDKINMKLDDIKDNYKDVYNKIDEKKLNDLLSEGINAKEAEQIIKNTIYKMELLKDEHEKSIYINQKLKELINKNEEIKGQIEEDTQMLEQLKENIESNVTIMKKNIDFLKQKI